MPDDNLMRPDLTTFVDRLTFGGNILATGTGSYRLAHSRTRLDTANSTPD